MPFIGLIDSDFVVVLLISSDGSNADFISITDVDVIELIIIIIGIDAIVTTILLILMLLC